MKTIETQELNTSAFYQEPTRDEIALAAFLAWESDGRPAGRDMDYWFKAEAQLRSSRLKKAEAAAAQASLPWPPSNRTSRVVKKAGTPAARTLTTDVKRTTAPKTAKRSARAA